jgi:hypothetical protein
VYSGLEFVILVIVICATMRHVSFSLIAENKCLTNFCKFVNSVTECIQKLVPYLALGKGQDPNALRAVDELYE